MATRRRRQEKLALYLLVAVTELTYTLLCNYFFEDLIMTECLKEQIKEARSRLDYLERYLENYKKVEGRGPNKLSCLLSKFCLETYAAIRDLDWGTLKPSEERCADK